MPRSPTLTWSLILLQSISLPNGASWLFDYDEYLSIKKITLPTGGTVSYTYTNTVSCQDPGNPPSVYFRSIASRTVDALDGTQAKNWSYNLNPGIKNTVTDPAGNDTVHNFTKIGGGLCSFYETKTQFYAGSSSAGTLLKTIDTQYSDGGPLPSHFNIGNSPEIGVFPVVKTTTLPSATGNLVSQETYAYDSAGLLQNAFNGQPAGGSYSFGVLLQKKEYDFGNGAAGPLLRATNYSYKWQSDTNYLAANMLDLVCLVTIYGPGSVPTQSSCTPPPVQANQVGQTIYGYDENNGSPQGVFGNQTSVTRWPNGGASPKTQTVYNTQGMPAKKIDANGNATLITYDSTGLFPSQIQYPATSGVQHIEKYSFDANTGLMLSHIDQNAQTTSYQYDSMRRVKQTTYPTGGVESISYNDSTPSPSYTFTKQVSLTPNAVNLVKTILFDGLGRVKQTQLTSDPQGTVFTDTTYDGLGRVYTGSNPYRTGSDPTTSLGTTTYFYDALGRKCLEVPPDGTQPTGGVCPSTQPANDLFTTYSGNTTTVTDQTGKSRKSVTDGLGRLTQVFEDPAGLNYETDYQYDALGNLLCAGQKGTNSGTFTNCASIPAGWRARNFTYDSLSRLLTSSNPEVGTITYTYDANNNVSMKRDNRNIATTYGFDVLNRELSRTYSDGTPSVSTAYDEANCLGLSTCQNIGHRTSMTDAAGSEAWSYHVDSTNPDTNKRTIHVDQRTTSSSPNNITKTSTYYLDLVGNVFQAVYPTGRVVNYTYDAANRPSTAADGSNGITYATDFQTAPTGCLSGKVCYTPQGTFYALSIGQTSSFTGLNLTHSYNSRLQPNEFKASSTGGNAIDITYGFVDPVTSHNAGHVYSITNNLNSSRTQNFTYDQLNRIKTAGTSATTGPYCWGYDYSSSYDPWGNLQSQPGATAYTGCTEYLPPAMTADGNNHLSGFGYDLSGNTTGDGVNSYSWNAESQLKVTAGSTYVYDGDGRRVAKANTATPPVPYKLYWYGSGGEILAETDSSGNNPSEYIFFGGKRIAMLPAGSTPIYYVEDLLGTSRVTTTNAGVVCYDADFYPFGGERPPYTNTCTQNNYKFEGKERDTETGNDDFGARYYSNRFGRWLSADWSAVPAPVPYANLTNPQTLNLYAMVADDPESFADLDGHIQQSPLDQLQDQAREESLDKEKEAEEAAAQAAQQAQNQANNHTGYDTQDQAARAALNNSNGASIKQNKEYAGLIYKDQQGKYHYTGPVGGTDQGANPHDAKAPHGVKVVGDYHTHGDYSVMGPNGHAIKTHDPHHDDFNSDHFSGVHGSPGGDKGGIEHDAHGKPEYRGYLGTPSGKFKAYNPNTGQEGVLQ